MTSIEHVALWTEDLEGLRWWYERWLGGRAGELYRHDEFTSNFLEFDAGAHAWATRGHLLAAEQSLDEQALEHRVRSRPQA